MDPTLTLQIPFILIGSNEYWNLDSQATPGTCDIGPIRLIHETLARYCKHVPVRLDENSNEHDVVWTLQRLPHVSLTDDETARLSSKTMTWTCAMALQRSSIPLDKETYEWRRFCDEAKELFSTLKSIFYDYTMPFDGKAKEVRWVSLVAGKECWLRMWLVSWNSVAVTLQPEFVKKVVMIWVALERELSLLATPQGLLEYWAFSRFLEHKAIGQLAKEKDELWRRLKDKENLTVRKKGTMYQRDKAKWLGGFDENDLASERTKGRRREWWDVVDAMEAKKLMEDVRVFQATGRRLVVECQFAGTLEDEQTTGYTPLIQSLSFPSYHSTLSISSLLAHTELLSSLLHLAYTRSDTVLVERLEAFRAFTLAFEDDPLHSFTHLLDTLGVSSDTKQHYTIDLQSLYSAYSDSFPHSSDTQTESPHHNLFAPLITYINKSLAQQRTYIPTFISRYTAAGGFYPTKGRKVYALMLIEEHRSKQSNGIENNRSGEAKKKEQWLARLERLGEAGVGDARERDENLNERARKSPVWEEQEGKRIREWVKEMRKR